MINLVRGIIATIDTVLIDAGNNPIDVLSKDNLIGVEGSAYRLRSRLLQQRRRFQLTIEADASVVIRQRIWIIQFDVAPGLASLVQLARYLLRFLFDLNQSLRFSAVGWSRCPIQLF